jgi:beta-glucanase (GH16 family)
MNRTAILAMIGILFLCACGPALPQASATPAATLPYAWNPQGWNLAWSDEFDGASINPKNWTFDKGAGGWGNSEMEYYTDRPENARIENGALVIEARQEKYEGSDYTSARLNMQGLHEFQYGRIEARMKLPTGKGLWSAFWMLGDDSGKTVGWPVRGEIDIMEYGSGRLPGNKMEATDYASGKLPYDVFQTVHGGGYSGSKGIGSLFNLTADSLKNDFHVYAIEWAANEIRWFVDGQEVFTMTPDKIPAGTQWAFNRPFSILINLAVGGGFGFPTSETAFPEQLLVDYVRVYQKPGN